MKDVTFNMETGRHEKNGIDFAGLGTKGEIKVVGYKTFRGMVALFKKINKDCKKKGMRLNFTIELPMKY